MKIEEFKIGETFFGSAGFEWRCTDIGTRTITAIMLDDNKPEYWFNGPPYSVEEKVFDEYEIKSLFTNTKDMLVDRIENCDTSVHPGFSSDDAYKMFNEKEISYPRKKLLKRDRVNIDGHILHPYSAIKKNDIWFIKTFEIFSRQFSDISEDEFVQLNFSTEQDMIKRKAQLT